MICFSHHFNNTVGLNYKYGLICECTVVVTSVAIVIIKVIATCIKVIAMRSIMIDAM